MKKKGVICAIDVNEYDQDVVDLAAGMASQFGVNLELVHVTIFPDPTSAAWPAYIGSPNELVVDHRRLEKIETTIKDVKVKRHHLSGLPTRQIVDFVKRNEPRLLVLGTHARHGLSRILGSVALKIMRKVNCPVMVLRQRRNNQQFASENPAPLSAEPSSKTA